MKIAILMATYNGEKFLGQQIQSILDQTYVNWELWIRDDLSTDRSVEIIKAYSKHDHRINLIESKGINLGVLGNFSKLLSLQLPCNYFMFCDQDDIWNPDKIKLSLTMLIDREKTYGAEIPILINTDLRMIDSENNILSESFFKDQKIKKKHSYPLNELVVENYVTGCTVLFNKPLLQAAMPIPEKVIMHDWWFALVAASRGKIETLSEVTVNYRQHSNNLVGAGKSNVFGFLFGWRRLKNQLSDRVEQLGCLKEYMEQHMENIDSRENRNFIYNSYEKIKNGGLVAVLWLIQREIKMQSKSRTLSFYLLVLIKSF
jgi:glycosyltransferase involved in cell wall biosynthesis